jgi:cell division protein FtsB
MTIYLVKMEHNEPNAGKNFTTRVVQVSSMKRLNWLLKVLLQIVAIHPVRFLMKSIHSVLNEGLRPREK